MAFIFTQELDLDPAEFADLLHRSTLGQRRPVGDVSRLAGMLRHADIVLTARNDAKLLVGISRAISDFHFCTYLSDLAVDVEFQRQGIGKQLIHATHEAAGRQTHLILLAAPQAQRYYPHIGMQQHESCWWIPGEQRD